MRVVQEHLHPRDCQLMTADATCYNVPQQDNTIFLGSLNSLPGFQGGGTTCKACRRLG